MIFSLQSNIYTLPLLESVRPNCHHKALMSKNKKKYLHVHRYTIFKIVEEQKKKDVHAACSLLSSGVEEFFCNFHQISLFATHLQKFLKDH